MKKVLSMLILCFFAASASADIAIIATDMGDGKVSIDYAGTELARAFALDITVDNGVITDINDFARGDENNGYGFFPANFTRYITVLEDGAIETWDVNSYTPVAEPNDPGALGGIDTNGITIELGSLYTTATPPLLGSLCTITCSESCLLSVTLNQIRGGVVLEDANSATVDLSAATNIPVFIDPQLEYTGPHPDQWETVGKPDCWVSSINPRQCHGDADGLSEGDLNYWVFHNDLNIFIDAWNKPFSELTGNQICADFDHLPQGDEQYRVSSADFEIFMVNWKLENGPAADCP